MSSTLSLHGSLQFPPGALERWLAATLPVSDPDESGSGDDIFAYGNDLGSVREVLEDVADCYLFVRFIVEGDTLQLRAALGDDFWCVWCGRIFALTQAAAALGARGEIDTEDDGCYSGTLVVAARGAVYVPAGPRRRVGKQEAARADLWRIWEEVTAAQRASLAARTKVRARKASAKKVSAKKAGAKKVSAKKVSAKKVSAKKAGAKKVSAKKVRARRGSPAQSVTRSR